MRHVGAATGTPASPPPQWHPGPGEGRSGSCPAAAGCAEFSRRRLLEFTADDLQFMVGEAVHRPPNRTGAEITVQRAAVEGIGTCQENISVCRVEMPASRSSRSRSPGVASSVR
jgi:hypothetical protein